MASFHIFHVPQTITLNLGRQSFSFIFWTRQFFWLEDASIMLICMKAWAFRLSLDLYVKAASVKEMPKWQSSVQDTFFIWFKILICYWGSITTQVLDDGRYIGFCHIFFFIIMTFWNISFCIDNYIRSLRHSNLRYSLIYSKKEI